MEHAIICPQCNAPLTPHRFASSIVCSYCGTTVRLDDSPVQSDVFHEAYRVWNSPESYAFPAWVSFGNSHWAIDKRIATGDIADVYAARRARWPTELALLKILRDVQGAGRFENEWAVLEGLQNSEAPGAENFTHLLPIPILHGNITSGPQRGQRASVFRWASGFQHTFEEVIRAYPQGVPPRASIWIWRRILEVLSFIHASGMVHGAVLPGHLLVQNNEHGVRLVGYGCAGRSGEQIRTAIPGYESFYPEPTAAWSKLSTQVDLTMSARCVIAVLGGDPATASLPKTVPAQLAGILERIALTGPNGKTSEVAWTIREELGGIAQTVYGAPSFIPIVMPS